MTDDDRMIYDELKVFFESLSWAKQHGLHYEFMEFFLRDYGNNKDVLAAITYANDEWDI